MPKPVTTWPVTIRPVTIRPATIRPATIRPAICFLFTLLLSASGTLAQEQSSPPLGGPRVKERKIPGVQSRFGEAGKPGRDGRASIPPEILQKAIGVLTSDQTPEESRLSDGQRERIAAHTEEFKASVEAYKAEHRAEMERIRRVLGDRVGPRPEGKKPTENARGVDTPQSAEESAQIAGARERMAEIRQNAPNPQDLHTRVWNELTVPQQRLVQAEVDRWLTERDQDMAREYVRKRIQRTKPGAPGSERMDPDRPEAAKPDLESLPPRLRERLARMSPEEREKAVERLKERIKERRKGGPDGPAKRRPDRPAGRPPEPPPMESVPVPSPEDGAK